MDSYSSDDSCSKSVEYGEVDYENSEVEVEESYIQKLDYERAPNEDVDMSLCKLLLKFSVACGFYFGLVQ